MALQLRFTLEDATASKSEFIFGRQYCQLCLPFCDARKARGDYRHVCGEFETRARFSNGEAAQSRRCLDYLPRAGKWNRQFEALGLNPE
jgi:hypothetical protein